MNTATMTTEIRSAVAEAYRETTSLQETVDTFLDGLLEAKDKYNSLNKDWKVLNEAIENYISMNPTKDDLTMVLVSAEGLITRANSIVTAVKKRTDYYNGIRTVIDTFQANVDALVELCDDIKIVISPEISDVQNQLESL
jgi:hypothetical protein